MELYTSSCYSYIMSRTNFEWDDNKDLANRQKHGVSFYEAQNAFLDPSVLSLKIANIVPQKSGTIALVKWAPE